MVLHHTHLSQRAVRGLVWTRCLITNQSFVFWEPETRLLSRKKLVREWNRLYNQEPLTLRAGAGSSWLTKDQLKLVTAIFKKPESVWAWKRQRCRESGDVYRCTQWRNDVALRWLSRTWKKKQTSSYKVPDLNQHNYHQPRTRTLFTMVERESFLP